MIPADPFVLLIIYLLLAAGAVWALGVLLKQMEVGYPWRTVGMVIAGILLLLLAFSMSGVPIFR